MYILIWNIFACSLVCFSVDTNLSNFCWLFSIYSWYSICLFGAYFPVSSGYLINFFPYYATVNTPVFVTNFIKCVCNVLETYCLLVKLERSLDQRIQTIDILIWDLESVVSRLLSLVTWMFRYLHKRPVLPLILSVRIYNRSVWLVSKVDSVPTLPGIFENLEFWNFIFQAWKMPGICSQCGKTLE